MNTAQLHIGVNLGLQKVASNIYDDFLSEEVDYYLNETVNNYIKQQYSLIKNEGRGIEHQYINENLRTLIITDDLAPPVVVSHIPNAYRFTLPGDYLYYIFSRVKVGDQWINNRAVEPKGIKRYIKTQHNDPIFREFPVLLESDKIIVIGDSTINLSTSASVVLTYIRKPNVINFKTAPTDELILPQHTHTEIVDLTVDKLLTVIQGRRDS